MFEVEALGLQELAQTKTLRIPNAICYGINGNNAFLVLEYVALQSANSATQRQLGQQLAQLHQNKQDYFGWHHDNYIGSNPQKNARDNDWVGFWQEQRLLVQLQLAADNGHTGITPCHACIILVLEFTRFLSSSFCPRRITFLTTSLCNQ
jgi:fructosamine-3-kinase